MRLQEVRVDALLQASGLSATVLLHALLPLIGEGGPLTCSHPDDPARGQTRLTNAHVCQHRCQSFLTLHLFASGVLQLNEQVASRSQEGAPVSVWLLPKQTYLNVDEDAAGTLERKRNYIYCLIVHIMKQEKEMHIDNLVFKVRGCLPPSK